MTWYCNHICNHFSKILIVLVSSNSFCGKVHPCPFMTSSFYNLCRLITTCFPGHWSACFFILSRDKSQKQSGIKNQDKQSGSVSVNPPSKENSATSARYYPQHRLLKIVVQTEALLPQSEPGVSNTLFAWKCIRALIWCCFLSSEPW